jgi:hypothetical protein
MSQLVQFRVTHSGLLLPAQHNWSLEVNVDNDRHLSITRLEEEMLDIAEQEIYGRSR